MKITQLGSYYRQELSKIGSNPITIKLISEQGKTTLMNLNKDSIKEIIRFFKSYSIKGA